VRISTKLATGLMGVGVLAVSFKLGLPAQHAIALSASTPEATTPAAPANPEPTTGAPTPTTPPKAPSNSGGVTPKPKPSKPATSGGTTTPVTPVTPVTPPDTTPVTPVTPATVTKTGDAIRYRFGTVQLSVTEDSSGTITSITTVQAGATGGRQSAFSSLKASAVAAQGSSFGNISQATYTTQAFKDALDSALAKF